MHASTHWLYIYCMLLYAFCCVSWVLRLTCQIVDIVVKFDIDCTRQCVTLYLFISCTPQLSARAIRQQERAQRKLQQRNAANVHRIGIGANTSNNSSAKGGGLGHNSYGADDNSGSEEDEEEETEEQERLHRVRKSRRCVLFSFRLLHVGSCLRE